MITGLVGMVACVIAIMIVIAVLRFVFELLGNGSIAIVVVILIVGFLLLRFGIL